MAGLVPAIHVFASGMALKAWMPATSAGMTAVRGAMAVPRTPLIPANAGIQGQSATPTDVALGPRLRGGERTTA